MSEAGFQRARQPEQKQQRRSSILSAAAALLDDDGFEGVSLTAIARRVGLAKSNVYRYFENLAEILLWLVSSDLADWTDEVEQQLEVRAGHHDADAVAEVLAAAFAARPRLCELSSAVVHSMLETDVSREVLLDYQSRAGRLRVRAANAVHAALPRVGIERWAWALRAIHAVMAGLWSVSRVSPVTHDTWPSPGWEESRRAFQEDLERAVRAVLYGVLVEASRESRR
jgi:AcrR family transcriptional regulator